MNLVIYPNSDTVALFSCCLPSSPSTMSSGDLIQMRVKYADGSKVIKGVSRTGTTVRQLLSMAGVADNVEISRVRILKGFPPKAVEVASEQDPLSVAGFENGESVSIEVAKSSSSSSSINSNSGAKRQKTTLARCCREIHIHVDLVVRI